MKTKLNILMLAVVGTLALSALGQVPGLINYQGRLVDTGGAPVNSNVVVAICIYTSDTTVVTAHAEDVGSVPVVNGLYSFTFGTNEAGMAAALANPEAWLEVKVDGTPLVPRQRLVGVPYARLAAGVEEGAIGSAQIADDTITAEDLADTLLLDADLTVTGANVVVAGALSVTGAVTAAKFVGDGSMLTSVDVSAHTADANAHHTPPTTLPPSGSAGGDLSGTYPDPSVTDDSHEHTDATVSDTLTVGALGTVDDGALSANVSLLGSSIESAEIADDTITAEDLADTLLLDADLTVTGANVVVAGELSVTGAVTAAKFVGDGSMLTSVDVSAHTADANAHHTPPTTLPPSGSAGGDLSGTYPDPSVTNDSHEHTDATVSDTLTVGALGTVDDGALSANVSLLGSSIESAEIADDTITAEDLADTLLLDADLTVTGANVVVAGALSVTGAVTAAKFVGDGSMLTSVDVSAHTADANAHHTPPTTLPPSGSAGGDLSGTYPDPSVTDDSHEHTDATVSDTLTVGALGTVDDGALSANVSLLGSSIESAEIADDTITAEDLADTLLLDADLTVTGANVVVAGELSVTGAVTAAKFVGDGSMLSGVGASDHGSLSGLGDDDHAHYFRQDATEEFGGNLVPDADDTHDLGSAAKRWKTLHVAGEVVVGDSANPAPAAGSIRWTGTAFEGFDGSVWVNLSTPPTPPPLVSPEMVQVGHAGNEDDPGSNGLGGNSGAVDHTYNIGKYEVTNDEYVKFLNAVDPTGANSLALYHGSMNSSQHGGISNNVSAADGAKFVVKPGFADKPVVYVSFYDAMRFCNWLHNGAVAGGDTESGAYTLLGGTATPSNGTTVERNAGAKFAVPTEDEWYKAAYYEPDGDTDDYWLYPTGGNSAPSAAAPPGTAPAANYNSTPVGTVTDVGAYTTTVGYYGTFDMAGNIYEWIETRSDLKRILRGGSWKNVGGGVLQSGNTFSSNPGLVNNNCGFRISSP